MPNLEMDLPRPVDFEDSPRRARPRITPERLGVLGLLIIGGLCLGLAAEFWPAEGLGNLNPLKGIIPIAQMDDADEIEEQVKLNLRSGNIDQALLLVDRLIEVDPERGHFTRGQIRFALKKYEDAVADLDAVLAKNPKRTEAYILRAAAQMQLKKYDAALEGAAKFAEIEARDGHLLRGEIYEEMKELDKAADEYGKALEADSAFLNANVRRYRIYLEKGDYEKALADAQRVADIDPTEGHVLKGDLFAKQGKAEDAIKSYGDAIEADGKNATAYNNRAYHRALARVDIQQAKDDIAKALALRGDDPAFIDTRGYLSYLDGDFKSALADFDKSLKMAKELGAGDEFTAEILYHRGLVYKQLGEADLADADFEAAKAGGFEWTEMPEPIEKKE